ncbi:MAG: glycosyltransferase [Prevotella sp.]|nr:glycosyltransferase [Prevotella sp.]
MKIAIVHDELVRRGGAEQFTLILHKAFPEAPIYTSTYNIKKTYEAFASTNIRSTWLTNIAKNEKMLKRLFFPFGILAMKSHYLENYDIVLMSTTTSAKYVRVKPGTLIIAYCHYPFRLLWFPDSYIQGTKIRSIKSILLKILIGIFKKMDYKAAKKIDEFITNTPEIARIINTCYEPKNPVSVMYSSISCSNFYVESNPTEDYYLLISRVEPYKKVDIAIDAFNKMPNKKLIIAGKGSRKEHYQKTANSNIEFRENLSKEEVAKLYANCKAFIFPQQEDYGLTPIEANASGRPVVAYGRGGITYTTIPYTSDSKNSTAIYFEEQTPECLIKAIELVETLEFDPVFIRKHAEKFDESFFIENIRNFVNEKFNKWNKQ